MKSYANLENVTLTQGDTTMCSFCGATHDIRQFHTCGKHRPEVEWFAKRMERKLRQNDHKPHHSKIHNEYLVKRLIQETDELLRALEIGSVENIIDECADIANFAMMIADNAGVRK